MDASGQPTGVVPGAGSEPGSPKKRATVKKELTEEEDKARKDEIRENLSMGKVFTGRTSIKAFVRGHLILFGADGAKAKAFKRWLKGRTFTAISLLCTCLAYALY